MRDNTTQRANLERLLEPQVRRADKLLQAAMATSNYFSLRASGEALRHWVSCSARAMARAI